MPKIWRRNCDYCGKYYKSSAKRFCSMDCRNKKRIGFKHSEETKRKIGLAHLGKSISEETRKKQSVTRKRIYRTGEAVIWCKGLTAETDDRLASSVIKSAKTRQERGSARGANNPSWKGGISKYKYAYDWRRISRAYRLLVQNCEMCGLPGYDVHHKDFDKLNNDIKNLMLLCRKCHRKVHPLRAIRSGEKTGISC